MRRRGQAPQSEFFAQMPSVEVSRIRSADTEKQERV